MKMNFKKTLAALLAACLLGGALAAQSLPEFDKPNSLVYDVENGKEEKFCYLIKGTDWAHDGKVVAEIWGYGREDKYGRKDRPDEWVSLGEITFLGFGEVLRLNTPVSQYVNFHYYAIQLKAGKRRFQIRADQLKQNLNFYFWEEGTDIGKNPLPYNSDNPDAYVFDTYLVDENVGNNMRIINKTETDDDIEVTVYNYNQKKHSWLTFGDCVAKASATERMTWVDKRHITDKVKDYRYYALNLMSTDGEKSLEDYTISMTKNLGGLYITIKNRHKDDSEDVEELKRQLEELQKKLNSKK